MATFDANYQLDDRYVLEEERVYLSGTQALVLLPMLQRRRDRAAGLNTAGFISGYRGSPLGGYDLQLWRAAEHLEKHHIRFEPGVNEELAATAVWGSQQVHNFSDASYDGVFAIWYGKGPGVDRSADALKHGNYGGAGPHGGVLVVVGDDHAANSSTIAFQSEQALVHMGIPVLNPSSVQEYLDFGLHGFAMSRFSGSWVGLKALTDTVDSSASVWVDSHRPEVVVPTTSEEPDGGLNQRWSLVGGLAKEQMVYRYRLPAVQAYARANHLDRVVVDGPRRRWGLVTTGKAYLDVCGALEMLGIDDERAADIGLSVYKVGLAWPLEPHGLLAFADGLNEIIVIEEKRPFIEDQIKSLLFNVQRRPAVIGKRASNGTPQVPAEGALSPNGIRNIIGRWLAETTGDDSLATAGLPSDRRLPIEVGLGPGRLKRTPTFCSGCPHSISTTLPVGSAAMGGIGCHGMAVSMPERRTYSMTQMGGEGATWIGQEPFLERDHIFQNIGDGTYFHSGLLAIRANVVAGRNITYKILANGAVALTGGQKIEGESMRCEAR